MDILVRRATIIDPFSPFHQQQIDVFIRNGVITEWGDLSNSADIVVEHDDLHLSPGWMDMFADFADPGFEYNETLESGAKAAAHGGFTDVMVLPNTSPAVHNKSAVEYIVNKSASLAVTIHPIGAITRNTDGKELSEMYDMHQSGAVAFSDGTHTLQSSGVLLKALQYLKTIDKNIIQVPGEQSLNHTGAMNEGVISTRLGLPGKPGIAEDVMIMRDLELAKYADAKIHFTAISTATAVELIRKAKAVGVKVTCSVTPQHLFFTDEDLQGYDTNLKVNPPFRTATDRDALRNAVIDGTVDSIASHHTPLHADDKVKEFEFAKDGMIALETAFAVVRTSIPQLSIERIVELFTAARHIFGTTRSTIGVNQPASLTLFAPASSWRFAKSVSRSANSPFIGQVLQGKPLGIINKDKVFLTEQIN